MNNALGFKRAKWGIARIYEIFARGEKKKEETWFNTFANGETENKFWRMNRDSVKLRLASHVPVIYANRRVYEIVLLK